MDIRALTDDFSVSPQIGVSDLAALAERGFRRVICNRPDGEADAQPAFHEIAAAARALGLKATYLPVTPADLSDAQVDAFARAIAEGPTPALAYCRSGMRSATLWALTSATTSTITDILATTQRAGYDLSGIVPRIDARSRAATRITPTA